MNGWLRNVRAASRGDTGSALVAAVAVSIIGMMLATVVVAQAIVVSKDTGTDRVRTVEVHGAEGAIDVMYSTLETTTPCSWPTTGTQVVNTAPDNATVSATITYWSATGASVPCALGVLTGTPAKAVITATATVGGTVTRTMQSEVLLAPLTGVSHSAAIFAANQIMTTNGATLASAVPGTPADLWVDSGNVDCNSSVKINGNLIVVSGTTDMSNSCQVTGDLWSKGALNIHSALPGGLATVGGNVSVKANASIADGTKIGGNLNIAGALSTWGAGPIVGGTTTTGATNIPNYLPVRLPEINYNPSAWVGFTLVDWNSWLQSQAGPSGNNAPTWSPMRSTLASDKCTVAAPNWSLNGPLKSPTTPTVWDTRYCSSTQFTNGLQLRLRSDLVIFARDFYGTGDITVVSDDGAAHKLWIIVPDGDAPPGDGTAQCSLRNGFTPGNFKVDSGANFQAPITTFIYTPCTIETNNTSAFYGQLYGRSVTLRNSMTMMFVPMGVPGVILPSTAPVTTSGYRVDIVFKREIKTP